MPSISFTIEHTTQGNRLSNVLPPAVVAGLAAGFGTVDGLLGPPALVIAACCVAVCCFCARCGCAEPCSGVSPAAGLINVGALAAATPGMRLGLGGCGGGVPSAASSAPVSSPGLRRASASKCSPAARLARSDAACMVYCNSCVNISLFVTRHNLFANGRTAVSSAPVQGLVAFGVCHSRQQLMCHQTAAWPSGTGGRSAASADLQHDSHVYAASWQLSANVSQGWQSRMQNLAYRSQTNATPHQHSHTHLESAGAPSSGCRCCGVAARAWAALQGGCTALPGPPSPAAPGSASPVH